MTRPAHSWVLALAALIAWFFLSDAPARAGHMPIASLNLIEESPFAFDGAGTENANEGNTLAIAANTSEWEFLAPSPPLDSPPLPLPVRLPLGPQAGGGGAMPSSSGAAPGPSALSAALLVTPVMPHTERGGRLAIENHSWNLPSFPSRLFRPPRGFEGRFVRAA